MFRLARPVVISLVAAAALAICGPDAVASTIPPIDDPATPDALNEAGERSSQAPYRLEMFMEMSGLGLSIDGAAPLVTGEFANGSSHMVMDFGAMFASMADQLPPEMQGADMTMEMVTQGTDLYLRAPFFAAMAGEAGGAEGPLGAFAALGDDWGYIDGTAIPGLSAAQLSGQLGIGGADPSAFFDMLANVEGTEQIGTEDIRGVSTVGVRADVSLADLMAAQGTDTSQIPSAGVDLSTITMPIEVWIDKDGFVRRLAMEISPEALATAAESAAEDLDPNMLGGLDVSMTMEMFDYDATDIVIEAPTEFVDVTEAFTELLQPQIASGPDVGADPSAPPNTIG